MKLLKLMVLFWSGTFLSAYSAEECTETVGKYKAEKVAVFLNDVSRDFAQSVKSPVEKTDVRETEDSWTFTVAVPQVSSLMLGSQLWEITVSKVLCRIDSAKRGLHQE